MLPKALLAAALASSTASAFLLPSSFDAPPPAADNGHHRHHPGKSIEAAPTGPGAVGDEANNELVSLVSPFYHEFTKVKVPCPGCSMQVRTRTRGRKHRKNHNEEDDKEGDDKVENKDKKKHKEDGKIITITGMANHINLFFKIDHTPGQDRLLVNGLELYPDVDVHGGALMAAQEPDAFDHPHHPYPHPRPPHHGDHEEHRPYHEHDEEYPEHPEHEEHHEEYHHNDDMEGESELKMRMRRHRKGSPALKEGKLAKVKHNHHGPGQWDGERKFEHKADDSMPPPPPPHHGGPPPPPPHRGGPPPPPPDAEFHGKHGMNHVKVPLGYSMQAKNVGQDPASGMNIVSLMLQVIEVNNVFVQEIPAVNVRLIHTAEGGLMIARIDVGGEENHDDNGETTTNSNEEATPRPFGHHGKHHGGHHGQGKDRMASLREELDKCPNLLCRWKVIISSSMRSHRGGCAGKSMGKGPKGLGGGDNVDEMNEDDEADVRPPFHRHHTHAHAHGGWVYTIKKFASLILFPIIIGIIAGVFAGLIGMLVGSLVIGLWRMFFRRGQSGSGASGQRCNSKAALRHMEEQAMDEEKAGLMAEAEYEPEMEDEDKAEAEAEAEIEAETETETVAAAPLSAVVTEAEAEAAPLMVTPPQAELPPYEDRDSKSSLA